MTPDLKRLCEAACFADGERDWPSSAYEDIVRAVLLAIKEPSEAAKDAGGSVDMPFYLECPDCVGNETAAKAFTAMIDAILAEPTTA